MQTVAVVAGIQGVLVVIGAFKNGYLKLLFLEIADKKLRPLETAGFTMERKTAFFFPGLYNMTFLQSSALHKSVLWLALRRYAFSTNQTAQEKHDETEK